MAQTLITNIQRYSVNDGPGIRTKVFIKGCPLRCAWCHNPECQNPNIELYWKRTLCEQCGLCLDVCPRDAIRTPIPIAEALESESYHKIDREKCDLCMKCVQVCPSGALVTVGDPLTVEQVLADVKRDFAFYIRSGGGMTVSGGEPTAYAEYVMELLQKGKQAGLHICLDTSGYCRWEVLQGMLDYVDVILYDLKHMDSRKHREMTGVPNELILENLKKLSASGKATRIRVAVIPGYNDSTEHLEAMASFVAALPSAVEGVDLLPYHNWCQEKYRWLGINWRFAYTEALHPKEVELLEDSFTARGLVTTVGG